MSCFPLFHKSRRGFTMIEILIVVGIGIVIAVVALSSLVSRRSRVELDNATRQIVATLREAQSRSAAQEGGSVWGVHFDNSVTPSFYALFKGASYSTSGIVARYNMPSGVRFSTSSVPSGGTSDITFSQVSGAPSTSTSLSVEQFSGTNETVGTTSSVVRSGSGKIFFDDFQRSNL